MITLTDWISQHCWTRLPWLMIGKGPSFARIFELDLSRYHTISLNHAVREIPVDAAHFIDLDAIEASAQGIRNNAGWLLVPRFLHVDFKPSDRPLEHWVERIPILKEFNDQNRLVCYCHSPDSSLDHRYPLSNSDPLIPVTYFSAEAVVRILAATGARTVHTVGVDGGRLYSSRYSDLNTCLANGHPSFDWQFISIWKTVKETNMDFGPVPQEIRVFVERQQPTNVPFQVLAYSIRKFASRPVDVIPLDPKRVPVSRIPGERNPVARELARFMIPELANYQGRAIYLQDSMLVLGDIAELLEYLQPEQSLQCFSNQLSESDRSLPGVMVMDCGKLNWRIQEILAKLADSQSNATEFLFQELHSTDSIHFDIPPNWNHRDFFQIAETKLLHYTNPETWPWLNRGGSLEGIWIGFFRHALESGAVDPADVERGVQEGQLLAELATFANLAPNRVGVVEAALGGSPSKQLRRLELERVTLAAHIDLLHRQFQDVSSRAAQLDQHSAHLDQRIHILEDENQILKLERQTLEEMCRDLQRQCRDLQMENQRILASLSLRLGSAVAKPVRMVRSLFVPTERDAA